jgi:hypothetical protein
MNKQPTIGQLAKTAKRLQARQPLAAAMFGRGSHSQPTPEIKELRKAPKPGSVTTGLTATRVVHQTKPRGCECRSLTRGPRCD